MQIELNGGFIALCSLEDYEYLSQWRWHMRKNGKNFYAVRMEGGKRIWMHREVLKRVNNREPRISDHINGDGLDNRRFNIRDVNNSQNSWNRRLSSNSTTGYKGVCYDNKRKGFVAYIQSQGKRKRLPGIFQFAYEAAIAYNKAAWIESNGFVRLNDVSRDPGRIAPKIETFQSLPKRQRSLGGKND